MSNFCAQDTEAIMRVLDNTNQEVRSPDTFLSKKALNSPHLLRLHAGDIFLKEGFPAKHVFVLLQGMARVFVYSPNGKMAVVDTVQAPHIFGATEAIVNQELYGASVETTNTAIVARLTREEYLQVIFTNQSAANLTIHYLAWLAVRNMEKSELKAITHPLDILIRYLYLSAQNKKLPHTIVSTRKAIADELHINIRTLYRYIDTLQKRGFLHINRSKIVISEVEFHRLKKEYFKIVAM